MEQDRANLTKSNDQSIFSPGVNRTKKPPVREYTEVECPPGTPEIQESKHFEEDQRSTDVHLFLPEDEDEEEEVKLAGINTKVKMTRSSSSVNKKKPKRKTWSTLCCPRVVTQGVNLHHKSHVPENEYSGYREGWKWVYELIYESSTRQGQMFDIVLFIFISISVIAGT